MRADRLLAELLLLQARERMTARQLADELEVSERTVYRDLYALQVAGVPVVAERGRGGGYSLYGDWRTDLTGMTGGEIEALSLLAAVGPAAALGDDERLRTALVKLSAGLPETMQTAVSRARSHIHIDPSLGPDVPAPAPFLPVLAEALRTDRQVELSLQRSFDTRVTRIGTLLGLVARGSAWHVVWAPKGGRPRPDRVGDVLEARIIHRPAERPPGFDLASFWERWRAWQATRGPGIRAVVRVHPEFVSLLRRRFRQDLVADDEGDGRVTATLPFETIDQARSVILGWGGAVQVVAPQALRRTVADFADQTAALYEDGHHDAPNC